MSESGSGRRGFVRDVMKRISSQRDDDAVQAPVEPPTSNDPEDLEGLRDALRFLGPEASDLVRRVERVLMDYELLRQRHDRARQQLYDAERQNEKLVNTLQDAKQQIDMLKEEVDKLCAPPNSYASFERANKDGVSFGCGGYCNRTSRGVRPRKPCACHACKHVGAWPVRPS